jgi:hypothetical protein
VRRIFCGSDSGERCEPSLAGKTGQVLRSRRKAVAGPTHEGATPASLDLQLVGKGLRLGLGGGLGRFAPLLPGRVSPLRVPDAAPLENARRELRASFALTHHRTRAGHLTARVGVQLGWHQPKTPTHPARARQIAAFGSLVDP